MDGKHDDEDTIDSYSNKCVRVEGTGTSEDEPLEGFVMKDMMIKNCG